MSARREAALNREKSTADMLPYTVQVDEGTVRTREGDLLRTFRLDGLAHECADDEDINQWHEGLNILLRNIASPKVAIYAHIVRRERTEYPAGEYENTFARGLNEKYLDSVRRERMLVNELYLTVVYRPAAEKAAKLVALLKPKSQADRLAELQDALEKLDELCQQVTSALELHQPVMLKERVSPRAVAYSKVGELFAYLMNGYDDVVPLVRSELRYSIGSCRPFFGREVIEQRGPTIQTFSGILSIKEYPPQTQPGMLDELLAAPYEFVLTQSFVFLSRNAAEGMLKRTRDRMANAGDSAESQILEMATALDDLANNVYVFGQYHMTLQVKAGSVDELTSNIADARTVLADRGMVIAREDVALESAFWSMFPANLKYRPRVARLTSLNFSGFWSLHNYPMGRREGNHWGPAVALLRTASGGGFFFNFHVQDVGHTQIIGPTGSGKTVIQGFLLAMAAKFGATTVFFDKDRGAEIAIRALGGGYLRLQNGVKTGFNPFAQELTPSYELFLQRLVRNLVAGKGEAFTVRDENEVAMGIKALYGLRPKDRRLARLLEILDPTDPNGIRARLEKWCGLGALAWVFDNEVDELDYRTQQLFGVDMTEFLDNNDTRTPMMMYLFERLEEVIDGRRFVVYVDEFWKALGDPVFTDRLKDALKVWRKKNGMLVTATQSPSDALQSPIARTLIEQSATRLFLPNGRADEGDYVDGFKLTGREYELIRTLQARSRRFLIKQGERSVVAELNLAGLDDELAVLSATARNVEVMEAAIAAKGSSPDEWLDEFHQRRRGS
jgi:type IV secretion system protein VirB4